MTYQEAQSLLGHPAAGLLRKDQAAFILAFLHSAYKQTGLGQVLEEDLQARLEAWLAERRAAESFEWERSGREYLEEWCSPRCGWLRRVIPGQGAEPVFEMTAATEKAMRWLEELGGSAFVGTESRMESIFMSMEQLLRETSPDVEERLSALRRERDELNEQIARIEETGEVTTLEGWQVNERFARLLDEAGSLLSEFRQVEENFRELAREVVERQSDPGSTKGEIIGRVLDSHDVLRESPQGRSFYGFVRLLLNPERRDRFEEQAGRVQGLEKLESSLRSNSLLLRLLPQLRHEQEKVGDSTQRLTSNLRRALESARLAERRRVRELVSDVQRMALLARDRPPERDGFFEVSVMPKVWPGASRPFWDEQAEITMAGGLATGVQEADAETITAFQGMPHLSLDILRSQVDACLEEEAYVMLAQVLHHFPPEHGLLEVLGYLVIAAQDHDRHYLSHDQVDEVVLPEGERWKLPRVMFGRVVFGENSAS